MQGPSALLNAFNCSPAVWVHVPHFFLSFPFSFYSGMPQKRRPLSMCSRNLVRTINKNVDAAATAANVMAYSCFACWFSLCVLFFSSPWTFFHVLWHPRRNERERMWMLSVRVFVCWWRGIWMTRNEINKNKYLNSISMNGEWTAKTHRDACLCG